MLDTKLELALMKIISEMVECPAGRFLMGSPENERGRNIYGEGNDFETQHKVAITQPFWIGKFLITEELYETIMEEEPINSYDKRRLNKPTSQVSYQEAKTFCKKLNKLIKQVNIPNVIIPTDYHFDLPTEAQWEYACRAGTTRAFNSNDNLDAPPRTLDEALERLAKVGLVINLEEPSDVGMQKKDRVNNQDNYENKLNSFLDEIAWYSESMLTPDIVSLIRRGNMNYYENNSFPKVYKDIKDEDWIQYRNFTKPVGQLLSNNWNIYDMHGNVHEWVRDTFKRKGDYESEDAIDPIILENGKWRVLRGGSYKDSAEKCRSAARYFVKEDDKLFSSDGLNLAIGFRVALVPDLTYEESLKLQELEKECKEFWKTKKDNKLETLVQALQNNKEPEIIKRLISESNLKEINASSKKVYYEGNTPLTAAATSSNNPEIVKLLLDCGENTSCRNDDGYTALQCTAFYNSNLDILNILLEYSKKDDFFSCDFDDFSESALCLALSQNENIEIIKRLIEYDPTLDKDNDYYSKLLIEVGTRGYKVFPCFKEIVKLLISKGADINKIMMDSGSAEYKYVLGEAIKYNNSEAVKCLLDLGADPNLIVRNRQNKVTAFPLYDCVNSRNNSEKNKILKLLLARNANINQKLQFGRYKTNGWNIAMIAVNKGDIKSLKILLNYEKNLLNQEDDDGLTLLDCSIPYEWNEDNIECLKFLIETGADVNHKTKLGEKAISRAFYFNSFKAIDILIKAGTIIDDENFMLIKNRINISCFEPSEKIKLLKRLYQAVGKEF